jgi:hypothetical protein
MLRAIRTFLFVGEARSNRAKEMGVRWRDGRLAAKSLFDALVTIGIDPLDHYYCNRFERGALTRIREIARQSDPPVITIVAMGKKVAKQLTIDGIEHIPITHPAARGRIRKKSQYANHLRNKLL